MLSRNRQANLSYHIPGVGLGLRSLGLVAQMIHHGLYPGDQQRKPFPAAVLAEHHEVVQCLEQNGHIEVTDVGDGQVVALTKGGFKQALASAPNITEFLLQLLVWMMSLQMKPAQITRL